MKTKMAWVSHHGELLEVFAELVWRVRSVRGAAEALLPAAPARAGAVQRRGGAREAVRRVRAPDHVDRARAPTHGTSL